MSNAKVLPNFAQISKYEPNISTFAQSGEWLMFCHLYLARLALRKRFCFWTTWEMEKSTQNSSTCGILEPLSRLQWRFSSRFKAETKTYLIICALRAYYRRTIHNPLLIQRVPSGDIHRSLKWEDSSLISQQSIDPRQLLLMNVSVVWL